MLKWLFGRSKAEDESSKELKEAVTKNRKTSEKVVYQSAMGSMKVKTINMLIEEVLKSLETKRHEDNGKKSRALGRTADDDSLRSSQHDGPKRHGHPSS